VKSRHCKSFSEDRLYREDGHQNAPRESVENDRYLANIKLTAYSLQLSAYSYIPFPPSAMSLKLLVRSFCGGSAFSSILASVFFAPAFS